MPAPGGDRTDQSAAEPSPPALLRCNTHTHMHSPGAKHTAPQSPTPAAPGVASNRTSPNLVTPGLACRSDASRDHGARNPHHPSPAAAIATCVAPTETRNAPGLGARATPVAIPPKLAAPGVGRRSDASRDHGARNPRHPAWPPPSRLASLPQEPATLPALTHERRQSRSPQNPQRPGWDVGATPVAITTPGIRTTPARPPPSRLASLPQEPATLPALAHERRKSRSPQTRSARGGT